jgi:hypothetical protein
VPVKLLSGKVAEMVPPEVVLVSVPIVTGEEKLPVLSESCAVKLFVAVYPEAVKVTETEAPAQYGPAGESEETEVTWEYPLKLKKMSNRQKV